MCKNNNTDAKFSTELEKASDIIKSDLFKAFLSEGVDRCSFISQWLKANEVPHNIVQLGEKKHIIVRYASSSYNPLFKQKTIVSHYDREEHTQGANDNSAACFQLMLFSKYLLSLPNAHNIKIIFTDGEEAGADGVMQQGSFALGTGLKKLKMDKDDIFVFDMCGRGDTLIVSESGIFGRDKRRTRELQALHSRACDYARKYCSNQWFSLLTAYSDNAGFIASGLKAQVITVLPRDEVDLLLKYLPKNKEAFSQKKGFFHSAKTEKTAQQALIDLIVCNKKPPVGSPFEKIIPESWQYMHTPKDSLESLTASAFVLVSKYLKGLAKENLSTL